jgi:hypothetical protein
LLAASSHPIFSELDALYPSKWKGMLSPVGKTFPIHAGNLHTEIAIRPFPLFNRQRGLDE